MGADRELEEVAHAQCLERALRRPRPQPRMLHHRRNQLVGRRRHAAPPHIFLENRHARRARTLVRDLLLHDARSLSRRAARKASGTARAAGLARARSWARAGEGPRARRCPWPSCSALRRRPRSPPPSTSPSRCCLHTPRQPAASAPNKAPARLTPSRKTRLEASESQQSTRRGRGCEGAGPTVGVLGVEGAGDHAHDEGASAPAVGASVRGLALAALVRLDAPRLALRRPRRHRAVVALLRPAPALRHAPR
eukprot:1360921-Rhodomonas_salina.1